MSKFIDKFLDSMKLNDEDDYDYEDDYMYDEEEDDDYEEEQPRKSFFHREKRTAEEEPEMVDRKPAAAKSKPRTSNVVPMRAATRGGMEVCMVKPSSLGDAREICDTLLSGRAVVINMEGIPTETAQKIIDFTSGACYSMNGNMQKISNYIFIATPQTVELSGDFEDLMGSSSGLSD
ncbi:cell division protein SepF [Lacrimispora sp. NSJ-141]|uniref:Cell division protein SepF n=1 Tax=Lientehia hominis TaxID=2897778 RepID=A0AAP2RF15_9FIRM|nr:cell division protein SepF [Lientehia hominis]MCD2491057.1 cell division protein SepF [Lientehia hominis]